MRKQKGITLVALVVTIIVLIILAGVSINLILGQNGIITKAREAKEKQEIAEIQEKLGLDILDAQMEAMARNETLEQSQLEDIISNYGQLQDDKNTIVLNDGKGNITLTDVYEGTTATTGSYTESQAKIALLESQVKTLEEQLEDATQDETTIQTELRELKDLLAQTTVTEDKILKDYTAYKDGALIAGTMANNGALNGTLNAGQSYTIPKGYTDGGTIVATDLASQTVGDASSEDLSEGKTAYVNGQNIIGTNTSSAKLVEFKTKIASAITDRGVQTASTDTVDTMVSNIRNIGSSLFQLENLHCESKLVQHNTGNEKQYTTDNKIVCVIATASTSLSYNRGASVGTQDYIWNSGNDLNIVNVSDYNYSIKIGNYGTPIYIVVLTEK